MENVRIFVSTLALSSCAINENAPNPLAPIREGKLFTVADLDRISFVSPGSQVTEIAHNTLVKIFPICEGPYVQSCEPYHADMDGVRFEELQEAIYGKRPYIWAVRGGYGSARLYTDLKSLGCPSQPKILMGHSDVTFLHLFFAQWGWKTIHCAMPVDLINPIMDPKNFIFIKEILENPKGTLTYDGLKPLNDLAWESSVLRGEIIGGNLSILTNSLGTPWQPKGQDKILFIEEAGEKGYVNDRDFLHLMQAGLFKGAKAVILGTFTDGDDNTNYALQRFADTVGVPVFTADFFGHGSRNYPLPFGFISTITPDADGTYTLTIPYDFGKVVRAPLRSGIEIAEKSGFVTGFSDFGL